MISNLFDLRDIQECIKQINENVKLDGKVTDGVVLHLTDKNIQTRLGRDGAINRYEVAYKFPAEAKKAIPKAVDYTERILALEEAIKALKDNSMSAEDQNKTLKRIVGKIAISTHPLPRRNTGCTLDIELLL
jgi:hypothetical protein